MEQSRTDCFGTPHDTVHARFEQKSHYRH